MNDLESFGTDPGESPWVLCPYCGSEWPADHAPFCETDRYWLREELRLEWNEDAK